MTRVGTDSPRAAATEETDEEGDGESSAPARVSDFESLQESAKEIKAKAGAEGNGLVDAKMDDFIEDYAKTIWMLKSALA